MRLQAKEDATELLERKASLEKEMKAAEEQVAAKLAELRRKAKTIGNYVHDSVPISNNEVSHSRSESLGRQDAVARLTRNESRMTTP